MSSEFPVAVQLPEDGCYAQSTITDSKKKYKIVFAVDLCTTLSGYVYSFASNKDAVHVNKNWGQTQGFLLHKTPTCLLLKSAGQFEAFGFEVTSRYNDLADEEAAEYYYFDRFKMKLDDNKSFRSGLQVLYGMIMRPTLVILSVIRPTVKKV